MQQSRVTAFFIHVKPGIRIYTVLKDVVLKPTRTINLTKKEFLSLAYPFMPVLEIFFLKFRLPLQSYNTQVNLNK